MAKRIRKPAKLPAVQPITLPDTRQGDTGATEASTADNRAGDRSPATPACADCGQDTGGGADLAAQPPAPAANPACGADIAATAQNASEAPSNGQGGAFTLGEPCTGGGAEDQAALVAAREAEKDRFRQDMTAALRPVILTAARDLDVPRSWGELATACNILSGLEPREPRYRESLGPRVLVNLGARGPGFAVSERRGLVTVDA